MKKIFLWGFVILLANLLPCAARAQQPAVPANLKADVMGHRVTLNWEHPDLGETLLSTDFELEGVPVTDDEISLDTDGWTVKTTNTSDYSCTWFRYPTSDFMGADNYEILVGNGLRSAVVFFDIVEDEHDMHQDEWLISPIMEKAAYLEFSYYIDPRVVENGVHPEYPDHYVVIASTDGGNTWGEPLWDARYDASTEEGWHTVSLTLADVPTDAMRVAFRAYGEYQFDDYGDTINQSLYATWAIDDVTVRAADRTPNVETLVSSDFEKAESDEDMSFEADGWTVNTTNDYEMTTTWFKNPVTEDDETFPMMVIEGERSAMVFPDEADIYQDEWLISPELTPVAGQNLSMRFSYKSNAVYIDEEEGFMPDETLGHYVVVVSKDGGETWGEPIWDLMEDDKGTMDEDGMFYMNTVTVNINAAPTDKVKVAFRAYGEKSGETDEETGDELGGLGGVWVIDNVFILSTAAAEGGSALVSHFKVMLDGKELADRLTECHYVDKSEKTPGEHRYAVMSVATDGTVSEQASVDVTLAKIDFVAPRNFTCTSELNEETGRYTVHMTWEAPETDFQPAYYTVYSDNVMFGTEFTAEQGKEGIGMSGCFGLYEFSIEAVYETPDGVSERVKKRLAMGVRYGVLDLKAETEGKDVVLSWSAPEEDGYTVASYTVYRAGEKLTEGLTATTWRDVAVEEGLYEYVVIVVYTDGVASVRTGVSCQVGDEVRVALPYEEPFNTTFMPVNWRIENQTERTPDKYTWYFDDQSRLGVKGPGFEGCYAAIDSKDILFRLNTTLALPAIDLTTAKDKKNVTLSFYYSYAIGGIFKAGVEFSLDGEEWYLLDVLDKENGFKPEDDGDFHIQKADMRIGKVLTNKDLENADVIYLRFRYEAIRSNFWAIDNVYVGEDLTALEKRTEDMDVVVSSTAGIMQVHAAQEIRRVEIYAPDGRKLAERIGGETTELTMPVPRRGPAVVRVTTAQGVKTVKTLL